VKSALKSQIDDCEQEEEILRRVLATARKLEESGDFQAAESQLEAAREMAIQNFGTKSKLTALALFQTVTFYAAQQKPSSAQFFYQQLQQSMRW
jgi:hypothetical protein